MKSNTQNVSKKDGEALKETLYLTAIPDMTKTIKQGLDEPIDECTDQIDL